MFNFRAGFWSYPQTLDKPWKPTRDKHSNLLSSFVSYKEDSQYWNFFAINEWARQARVFVLGIPLQPSVMKHSSLLGPSVLYKEMKCCDYAACAVMIQLMLLPWKEKTESENFPNLITLFPITSVYPFSCFNSFNPSPSFWPQCHHIVKRSYFN